MKRALGFILTLILILNTAVTLEISVRAENAVEAAAGAGVTAVTGADDADTTIRTSAVSRADKILGLEQYDEYGISESDADIYEYQVNLKYPTAYLVEAAEERFGFTDLMTVVNKFNNEEFRLHPEYYYEAALLSLLFEQAGDSAFLEGNEQDVLAESSQAAGSLLGFAVGQEADALEELKKKTPQDFAEQQYLDSLNGIKQIQNGADILSKILGYAKDAYDVILYAKNLEKILELQEETITFLTEMKERTDDNNIRTAIDTVLNVYEENQRNPDALINIIIQMDSTTMAFEKLAWNALETTWDVICASVPVLQVANLALGIEGFVLEYAFASDAISDAYAKLEAICQLESVVRKTVKDMGEDYINIRAGSSDRIEELAEVFNVGWDFFTVLLDADCQASLLFAKATFNAGVADFDIWALFSGSVGYDEFAGYIRNYQGAIARWKNNINMYMEGLKPENRKVGGAAFREHYVEMEPGDTYILSMDLLPEDAADKYIRYGIVSDDKPAGNAGLVTENNVVKIEGNTLTALAQGTVEIEGVAGDAGKRDTMIVYVGDDDLVTSDGLLYRIEDGKRVIITGYEGDAARVEIPSHIYGLPVVEVETFTGENGRNITVKEVILPDSVTRIWNYAFYRCVSLQKINLEKVNYVGEYAFAYCSRLENIVFQNYQFQVDLRQYAFYQCTSLQSIDLSTAMRTIPEGLCYGCTSLKKVIFPEDLWRIHKKAFYNCGFEELYLPKLTMQLDEACISHCENLKKFYIPDNYMIIPDDPEQFINAEDTVHYVVEGSAIHSILEGWNKKGYDFKIAFVKKYPDGLEDSDLSDSGSSDTGQNDSQSGNSSGQGSNLSGSGTGQNDSQPGSGTGSGTPGGSTDSTGNSSDPSGGSASSGGGKNGQSIIRAKNIKKTRKSKKIKTATVGKTVQLKVKLSPANATEKPVWTSGKPKVATVSPDGKVTPKKKGETKIIARIANGKKVTWKIKVKELKAKKISLNKKKVTLHAGGTLQLKTKLKPKGSTAKIKWKSSKKKVASVSQNGTVTARKKGKAVITAQLPNGKKAKCKITVKKAVPQNGGNTSDGSNTVTQPGGDTGNRPGTNPGGGSGTPGDNQNPGGEGQNPGDSDTPGGGSQKPGDSDISGNDSQNPDDSQNPGGDGSDEEKVPTKLTLATDNLALEGRWQTIALSVGEETETSVGEKLKIAAEPDSFYGDSQILDAEITEGNDMQRIHWNSADETIVKVYNGGLIRGVRTGTTTVTATTTDGTTAKCQVTVEDADLQWESSNTEVAEISSVDDDGRTAHITARKEGTADITVCSGTYQSTCRLTVSADGTDPEKPTEPTDSTEPTEPTDPTDSTEPTEPTDPDDSDKPGNPDAKPISTVEDLKAIVNNLDGDYILTKDLNLNEENWTPIGTQEAPFTGTLDGDGHTIEGLAIKGDSFSAAGEYYYGLFGVMEGASQNEAAKVCDLTIAGNIALEGSITQTVQTDSQNIQWIFRMGAFAGNADNWSIFENCVSQTTITVDVTAREDTDAITIYAGGISGGGNTSNNIFFKECVNKGNIRCKVTEGKTAGMYIGGITGRGVTNIAMDNCQNDGDIYASGQTQQGINVLVGGMAGELLLDTNIVQQCKNQGDVVASADMEAYTSLTGDSCIAGGIIGRKGKNVNITDSVNTGTVKASSVNQIIQVHYGSIYGKINQ